MSSSVSVTGVLWADAETDKRSVWVAAITRSRRVQKGQWQRDAWGTHSQGCWEPQKTHILYCLAPVPDSRWGQEALSSCSRCQPPAQPPSSPTTASPGSPLLHRVQVTAVDSSASGWSYSGWSRCPPGFRLLGQGHRLLRALDLKQRLDLVLGGVLGRTGRHKEHRGSYSVGSFSFSRPYCSFLNSPSDWNSLTHLNLECLNKMKC